MIVALDTGCLMYVIAPGESRVDERAAAKRVADFIAHVRAKMDQVIVPAPAFAELLAFFPAVDATRLTTIARQGLRVAPTDQKAAAKAADIWRTVGGKAGLKRLAAGVHVSYECVKTDWLVVATAMTHGADEIVSIDHGVKAVCERIGFRCRTPEQCVHDDNTSGGGRPDLPFD